MFIGHGMLIGAEYGGTKHTPNGLPNAACTAYWETHDDVGAWAFGTDCTLPALDTWSENGLVVTGTGPWTLTCTGSSIHRILGAIADFIDDYVDLSVDVTSSVIQWIKLRIGTEYCNFDVINGAVGNSSASMSGGITVLPGGGYRCVASLRVTGGSNSVFVAACNTDNATHTFPAYASTDACVIAAVAITQAHLSRIDDQSLTALGVNRNAHLAQADIQKQAFLRAEFATINSIATPLQNSGRAVVMNNTNPDVLALAGGIIPVYVVYGVVAMSGDAQLCRWSGAGNIVDIPVEILGAELQARRDDGVALSTKTYGSGLASLLATGDSIAVVVMADGSHALYVGGTLRATITHGTLSNSTMTNFEAIGTNLTTAGKQQPALVLANNTGDQLGATAADVVATLNSSGGFQQMGDRWGVST